MASGKQKGAIGCLGALVALVGVVVLIALVVAIIGDEPRAEPAAADAGADEPAAPYQKKDRGTKTQARPTEQQTEAPSQEYLVTRVVDGDTLELGNGETVRLVGIDTPEVGECGFEESSARLGDLVAGREVTLGESDEDRDQYDRLLRYVDVGGLDAGLRLIKEGFAIARYDSRDGYGRHPREDRYVAADEGSRNFRCAPEPRNLVDTGGGKCEPGYTPCVPLYPPDVDCGDVNGPIAVTGSDPHGLDGEGDGIACE
jgi:endonuclease YncB( thermonuclease family)